MTDTTSDPALQPVVYQNGDLVAIRNVSLQEVVDTCDIVTVNNNYLVVTPRNAAVELADKPYLGELGGSGTSYYQMARDEYNPALRGSMGLRKFDEMRKSDGQVKMTLRLVKTPILGARWYMQPASNKKKDVKIAEFVWDCLTKYQSVSWPLTLIEILSFLDFGHYAFEKVYTRKVIDGKQRIVWQKFAPRHPLDIQQWDYDENGGPNGMWLYNDPSSDNSVFLPIKRGLVFTYEKEAGNMQGTSVLRSAYKHYYYKDNLYKVDAIQKERHGIGIPVVKLPPGYTQDDKSRADELGRNLRTNEKAHVTLPPMWDLLFAEIKGQPVDCIPSIEHHNRMISRTVLANFIEEPRDIPGQADLFLKGTRFIADIIRDVFNKWAIPELVDFNFPNITDYPELKVRRLGDTVDWRTISFALRNLTGAGIVRPDDKLEDWIRDEMDLPLADPATRRDITPPQLAKVAPVVTAKPGEAPVGKDLPNQSTAPGMQQQAQGTGKDNVGKDGSGQAQGN